MFNTPPVTKNLLIINLLAFIATLVYPALTDICGLHFFMAADFNVLQLFTYSYEHNDLLRSLYYTFNKQRRCWQKIIYASDLELEYEQIKDIPKQRIQIQKYEQAKENNPFAAKN